MIYRPIEAQRLAFLTRADEEDRAAEDVRDYLAKYSGRHFETLGRAGHDESPNQFTAADLLAVSALSVEVPIEAAAEILSPAGERFNDLLSQVPDVLDLWDAAPSTEADTIGPGSPAVELWNELNALPGMGWVTTGKLLARKRPKLIPIYDSVVKSVLDRHDGDEFWRPLRDLLAQDCALVERLCDLAANPGRNAITPLRALDIATWMHGKARR